MRIQFVINNARRDLANSIYKIGPFIISIIIGIGTLVAMTNFSENVVKDIDNQAKEMLGADLELRANHPVKDSLLTVFRREKTEMAKQFNFASMAFDPKHQTSRMVDLRALEKGYPFYGALEISPKSAWKRWENEEKIALVDSAVLYQMNLSIGDSLRFGKETFEIAGALKKGVGQSAIMAAAVPIIYFPFKYLESTALIQKGSRVNYRYYMAYSDTLNIQNLINQNDVLLEEESVRAITSENNTARIGRFFNDIDAFLKLISFVSLLLGCIGVSSGIFIYVKSKLKSIAILRCLGATAMETFMIYLLQILFLGLIGGIIGSTIGVVAQFSFPALFGDLLMVELSNDISIKAIAIGILLSVIISILFGWYPLLQILNVSPIYVLRSFLLEGNTVHNKKLTFLLFVTISGFILFFSYWLLEDITKSFIFLMAIFVVILILGSICFSLISILKRRNLNQLSFSLKYGISQLFRPNNQTLLLGTTIGLGVFLIICMLSIRGILMDKVSEVGNDGSANLILYDVQKSQKEKLADLISNENLKVEQEAAVVTMSLEYLNGNNKKVTLKDSTKNIKRWVFDREYRVTYRDHLKPNEVTVKGEFTGKSSINEVVPISVSESFMESSGLQFDDILTFNVQGFELKTRIAHIRKVDFARMEANFVVLFPSGVLEAAPSIYVFALNVKEKAKIAQIQNRVIEQFPNVSAIDLGLVFNSINEILGRVSFVFRWLGGLCIFTGLLVLWSFMSIGKYQRKKEAGVLRAIGAKKKHLIRISLIEYFSIGSISTLTGIILGWIGSWCLAYFVFDLPFYIAFKNSMILGSIVILMTILIGVLFMRTLSKVPSVEVLKED
ncbi:ABC transporter permease [Flammeovirga aprica]|uniref:FtsX-like permease family protein n=1 Tax=Flammeovirga aprica JL-4 TaxID=694437 RepID=A0A7X9XC52_9BACT|nr:FtsX-like permease family protein [Flammeovirga aprica]NME71383.1 FtsX-like permease family protein [Flammeovirga aprica JL-4]